MELHAGERQLWSGKPKQGIVFRGEDLFMVPFSAAWCGFALFWERNALRFPDAGFFSLMGALFVLVGLYVTVGRFIHDWIVRKNTEYFVTDRRVIIRKFSTIESIPAGEWKALKLREYADGSGTILFDEPSGFYSKRRPKDTLLSSDLGVPAFFRIDNPQTVMGFIEAMRKRDQ